MNTLAEYFGKLLDINFPLFRFSGINEVFSYISIVSQTLKEDVQAKHPYYEFINANFEENILYLMRIDPTIEAVVLYRLERAIFLNEPTHPLLPYLASLMRLRTGIEFYYSTEIGPGLNVQHGVGIVIGPRYTIGRNFIIHQGVTIGQSGGKKSSGESIVIGDNVIIYAGAKIIGNVRVGDNAKIGANSVLTTNAKADTVYFGIPAQPIW